MHYISYIDGGTGSMLLQAALAGLLGAAVTIKTYWHAIKLKFQRVKPETAESLPENLG